MLILIYIKIKMNKSEEYLNCETQEVKDKMKLILLFIAPLLILADAGNIAGCPKRQAWVPGLKPGRKARWIRTKN